MDHQWLENTGPQGITDGFTTVNYVPIGLRCVDIQKSMERIKNSIG